MTLSLKFPLGGGMGLIPTSAIESLVSLNKRGQRKKLLDKNSSIWLWRLCKHHFTNFQKETRIEP